MSARLTVVFDDDALYRRLKVRAAEDGVALKDLIEAACREYLGTGGARTFDWAEYVSWRKDLDELDEEIGGGTTDYSDVKKYLYGSDEAPRRRMMVAEERVPYDAQ